MIFEGKYKEAKVLVNQKFISKTSHGIPHQTVGNLRLLFSGHESYSNYYREPGIEKTVVESRYNLNGINHKTKVFASFPDQ